MKEILLLFLLLLGVSCHENYIVKKVFLKTPQSYVNVTSESWKMKEDIHELIIALRFIPKSEDGQVLSLQAINQTGNAEIKLTVSLSGSYLQLDLFDENNANILNKPMFSSHSISQSIEHSLAIRLNTGEKTLSYRLEQQTDHVCEILEDIDFGGMELVATLGGGDKSLIGCVTLVALEENGFAAISETVSIVSHDTTECENINDCTLRDCGKGKCLQLEIATCDCYGTEKSGPNCRTDARSVFVSNNDDESISNNIKYIPWTVDRFIERITMDFKFAELDNKQGVLLHSFLDDGTAFKLFVVEKNGNLIVGKAGQINFTLSTHIEFHTIHIAISHENHTIQLTVDGQIPIALRDESFHGMQLSSLLFGASPPSNGAHELGITACLKNIYVDHYDIIGMMYEGDERVKSSKPLRSCSDSQNIVLTASSKRLFDSDPVSIQDINREESRNHLEEAIIGHTVEGVGSQEDTDPSAIVEFGISEGHVSVLLENGVYSSKEKVDSAAVYQSPPKKTGSQTLICDKSQDYVCRNGASCEKRATGIKCLCRNGFGGKYCQFVLLPRTCSEASLFFLLPDGPTKLDIDGSRSLSPSIALCQKGQTIIPHDMPNSTVVRETGDLNHALFLISYRDFTSEKLAGLIRHSENCQQYIQYDCIKSPLGFDRKLTWFHVASNNRTVSQIGKVPHSCVCLDKGCINHGKCNCDSQAITQDAGYLFGKDAGVTRMVAIREDGAVSGKITIGQLCCEGFGGLEAIRFTARRSLPVRDWNGEPFSFQFRTADASCLLLSIEQEINVYLKIELINGHSIRVLLSKSNITVESQAKLNDTKWHLIVLEFMENEIRIGIDKFNAFGSLNGNLLPKGKLIINDDINGFIGCIRSFVLSDTVIDIQTPAKNMKDIYLSCKNNCMVNMCQNGAECIDDFITDSAFCQCKFPNIQSGRNCEIDINVNSSVSFHGGFLKYEQTANALLEQTVLSFRTDQANALILFVHDHNNNFLQLHLSDEMNLTLSLNNEEVVSSCNVRARPGTEFGDMKWIQIVIDHSEDSSTLSIDNDACTIRAKRQLAVHPVQKFINVFTDVVIIPVGLNFPAEPKPFLYTFIGGVEKEIHSSDGSMLLRPIYQSAISDLLGCIRGVRIGRQIINLQHAHHGYRPNDPAFVRLGCNVSCETLDCYNGGHCSVAWKNYDPTVSKTSCDCSRTSYAGPNCTIDDGIILTGSTSFSFDIGKVLARYILTSSKLIQTLKFAFSPNSPSKGKQILATIYFKDGREFEVILNKNGTINVGILATDQKAFVKTFHGNFADGYRHFFVAEFGADVPTAVMVDSVRQDFHFNAENLNLHNATHIVMGGQKNSIDSPDIFGNPSPKRRYEGCISNLNIGFQMAALQLTPLTYLDNWKHPMVNFSSVFPQGPVLKGSCAPFRIPNSLPVFQNNVELPVWDTNFKRLVYHIQNSEKVGDDGEPQWLWILIIIVGLLILALITCFIFYCCCIKASTHGIHSPHSKDEEVPLNNISDPSVINSSSKISSNYYVPPPDTNLDQEALRAQQRLSWQSGLTAYFTAQEEVSEDGDLDITLKAIEEEQDDQLDTLQSTSYDRTSPQRMSSFRRSDPTVPPESPLYAPVTIPGKARPVQAPVPPPRLSPH